MMKKFDLATHGLGAHVIMKYQGRTLLGTVLAAEYDDHLKMTFLAVCHFSGALWPIEPASDCVEVLERTAADLPVPCSTCDGTGDCLDHDERYIDVDRTLPCERCGGTGQCPTCRGEGTVVES